MPRPKRTKVAPSAPAPRVRKRGSPVKVEALPPAAREDSLDLYNASDPDVRAKKNKGKAPAREEGLRTGGQLSEPTEGRLESGNVVPGGEDDGSLLGDIDLESSSPAVEVGRRDRSSTAIESSILAIGNFRRRPRQPSILGRGTARARSSSIGLDIDGEIPAQVGSALRTGNFSRREREPSILRTAQKTQQWRGEYDGEDEDDFNPEDESTPLNLSKTRAMTTSSAVSSSNPRKRKLSAVQVPQSSPTLEGPKEQETVPATAPLSDDAEEGVEIPSSPPEAPITSIEPRPVTPEVMSETMAPPQSSSSSPESLLEPRRTQRTRAQTSISRGRRPLRGRTPPPATQDSPISSPPSLTHSPNRPGREAPKHRGRRQPPPISTFSTAQLEALLPRRRRQTNRDPFDIASSEDEVDVSGLASDDDELTNLSVPPATRRARNPLMRRPAPLKKPAKSKAAPKPNSKTPGRKTTYGRQANATSDKENEEHDPDDSLGPLPDDAEGNDITENSRESEIRLGKELEKAAKKFQEVDKWELEFEEVTASSSSPRDAR
ncbi:hypothetical protein M430DRAFT_32803 [Amorphotheca resinae ATCC 22711]|uniref:Uncharacterized protein n=1 Tax=Amorphotheca resinae ATCC 22711 TaxID=857342 RepID=A0A2T3BGA7_AMORE|nr:hypothetical protein M430DRAFT_32803 [Amorphotheca resinae ATCC 22711]PSS28431.1 hypothetical protein M430DRAFT_32803 [Amorphotheca resinae ATCC 22711]